jgi:hypothetical protein
MRHFWRFAPSGAVARLERSTAVQLPALMHNSLEL